MHRTYYLVLTAGCLLIAAFGTTDAGRASARSAALPLQGRADGGSVPPLPATLDGRLRAEIERATSAAELEDVLDRHPDQGQLIVPRIEAIGTAEIRRDSPGTRFVITEIQPDEGPPASVTVESAGAGGVKLTPEFPGDGSSAAFTDGSVHRFVGTIPFANLLTLYGDGDRNHRLTFAVIAEYGMVYLRGRGRVVLENGRSREAIQLSSPR